MGLPNQGMLNWSLKTQESEFNQVNKDILSLLYLLFSFSPNPWFENKWNGKLDVSRVADLARGLYTMGLPCLVSLAI